MTKAQTQIEVGPYPQDIGSVSIIATATGATIATVGGGPGTSTLDAAITDIAFGYQAGSRAAGRLAAGLPSD